MKALEQVFRIPSHPSDVTGVLNRVEEFCLAHGLAADTTSEVRLVAEEVLTNIVKYACDGGGPPAAELRLSASPQSVRMEFRDEGAPFNPLDVPAPDLNHRLESRAIGGLGIHLARSLVDEASYFREEHVNILVLIKHVGTSV